MSNDPRTPAGERVKQWFRHYATVISQPLEALDFDAIAKVALNRVERDAPEEDVRIVQGRLAEALKAEFGHFMQTNDDEWLATARTLLARMEARTMVLTMPAGLTGLGEPQSVEGVFIYSPVETADMIFPRVVFYERDPRILSPEEMLQAIEALEPIEETDLTVKPDDPKDEEPG